MIRKSAKFFRLYSWVPVFVLALLSLVGRTAIARGTGNITQQRTETEKAEKKDVTDREFIMNAVTKLSGSDFDKAYLEMEIKVHSKDLSAYQKELKDGKDPEVKAWAAKTVPMIEKHLKMARDLSK